MNSTEEIIEFKLAAYLNRRSTPRNIRTPEAEADEMDSILRRLLRYRPSGNLDEWWQRVEDGLAESCETYSWPLPRQFSKAAEAASKTPGTVGQAGVAWEADPVKVAADRMNAGEAVGEFWLYGEKAVALEESGRVGADTFKAYRSAAYFNRVHKRRDGTEDRTEADAWEAQARKDHAAAKSRAGAQDSGKPADVSGLVKTFGAAKETPSRNDEVVDRGRYMTADEIAAEDRRAAG